MGTSSLRERRCVACDKGTPPLTMEQASDYLSQVPEWAIRDGKVLRRRFRFRDFLEAMSFVNRVAALAEDEGHHPDILISYNRVRIDLTTHAIEALSDNDFVMAAKIDGLVDQ